MNKYEKLANEIIDAVSRIVMDNYNIKPKLFDEGSGLENPALINGVVYYDLECQIADKIKRMMKE